MIVFEDYLAYKGDEIDNAAYNLAVALLRTDPKQSASQILEWDMALIAPIIEAAIEILKNITRKSVGLITRITKCLVPNRQAVKETDAISVKNRRKTNDCKETNCC